MDDNTQSPETTETATPAKVPAAWPFPTGSADSVEVSVTVDQAAETPAAPVPTTAAAPALTLTSEAPTTEEIAAGNAISEAANLLRLRLGAPIMSRPRPRAIGDIFIQLTDTASATSNKETDPHKIEQDKHFQVLEVAGKLPQIYIKSTEMRIFLSLYTVADRVLSSGTIPEPGDHMITAKKRDRAATLDMEAFFPFIDSLIETDIYATEEGHKVGAWVWGRFTDVINKEKIRVQKESDEDTAKGLYTYMSLERYFSQRRPFVLLKEDRDYLVGKVVSVKARSSMFTGPYLEAKIQMYAESTGGLKPYQHSFILAGGYSGKKTLEELEIVKFEDEAELSDTHKTLLGTLRARGEKALKYMTKPSYLKCTGDLVRRNWRGEQLFRADGRVMIDRVNMEKADPNYDKYFGGSNRYHDDDKETIDFAEVTEVMKMSTSPYLYGYSFVSKRWGELRIDDVAEIVFRTDAYDKLVMDPETKTLLRTLVATGTFETNDVIDGKGGGCIALLEGPPGIGKTLSAEVISETLKKPLYMVSVGELGTSVSSLEDALQDILNLCQEWNAVLLIDEADIFLEARTDLDIERNAMVAVFLRLLEYYNGIMFLTTNRADNIDQAFYSRISVAISYPNLIKASRIKIWTNTLSLFKGQFTEAQVNRFASYNINGRQIKNIVRNAASLAKSESQNLREKDIQLLIDHTVKFGRKSFMKHVRHFFARIFR